MSVRKSGTSGAFTIVAIMALAVSGCSTQVKVEEIAIDLPPGTPVNGIPFRVPGHFKFSLYELKDEKYKLVESSPGTSTMADMSKLFVLKVEGSALSDSTVNFKLTPDGLVDTLKVISTSKGQASLTELSSGIKSIATAEAARDKARETEMTAGEDADLAALQAEQDLNVAKLELKALPSTATDVARAEAQHKVERLSKIAEHKKRRASAAAR